MSWSACCGQLANLDLIDQLSFARLLAEPPTKSDYVELDAFVVDELLPPALSSAYSKAVLRAFRGGKVSRERAVELLRGTLSDDDLPAADVVPLESLRGDLTSEL